MSRLKAVVLYAFASATAAESYNAKSSSSATSKSASEGGGYPRSRFLMLRYLRSRTPKPTEIPGFLSDVAAESSRSLCVRK